jgi:hypothetical protein
MRRSILMMMTLTWFLVVPTEHVQCVYTSTARGDLFDLVSSYYLRVKVEC